MQINPKEIIKRKIITNLFSEKEQVQQCGIDLSLKEPLTIQPGKFKNIELNEKFDMQDTLGIIKIRSSLSRKGINISSGYFDPFFEGVGGISLYNHSDEVLELPMGFRVCQMVCFKADYAKKYDGFYNKNKTIKSQY